MRLRFVQLSCFIAIIGLTSAILYAENWPGFRGPIGQGISTETNLPLKWSATENIAWKTPIPGVGWSSPILFGDQVFLTTVTDEGTNCHVLALDRKSGAIQWDKSVHKQSAGRKEGKNSYATPTPVTDGQHVYAVFADGAIVALTVQGEVVWENHEVNFYSKHGLGASPILADNLLIMCFDGSSPGDDKEVGWKKPWENAVVLALDKTNGKEVWRGKRGLSRIAHVTPRIASVSGKPQLISGAGDAIQGFDLKSGERIWNVFSQGEGVVPSIVIGDGLYFSVSGFEQPTIRAIKPGGSGDVTKTHIAWEQKTGVPSLSSLLYVKPYLYSIIDSGVAHCYDGATGKVIWKQRIGGNHSASPVSADGKIYFLSEQGETTIVKAGDKFEELAKNPLGEHCQASLAISQGQIFIRTDKHLFCIGK